MLPTLLTLLAPVLGDGIDLSARLRAGTTLGAAVERVATSDMEPPAARAVLRAAANVAATDLEGQRVGGMLEQAVLSFERGFDADPIGSVTTFERDLASLADDLAFQPRMEAPQPPGFPSPTPLHEIRLTRYPGYRLAFAEMSGPGDGGAFFKLFRHIQSNEIAMTAPVEVTLDPDRLRQTRMAFLYEGPTQGAVGTDGAVEVVDVPPMTVVSIGCRGYDRLERVEALHRQLRAWVAEHPQWAVAGHPRTMGFNSPMVRGDQRFFEVQLPVRPAEPEAPAPPVEQN